MLNQKPTASKQARLYSLDYLRGICALGIMIFHYLMFTGTEFDSSQFMARVGFYGVSIFYILSGLTLYSVYQGKDFNHLIVIKDFFKKRFARIYPLYIITTIFIFLVSKKTDFLGLILNITGLFAILDWSNYFVTGGWSIGNELFFYLTFPVVMIGLKKSNKLLFYLLSLISIILYIYFPFFILNENLSLSDNWHNYVNPLNQWFLFLSGILIAYFLNSKDIGNKICLMLSTIAIIGFIFYPVSNNNSVSLVTDYNRLIFTILSITLTIGFFKLKANIPQFIHKPLAILGEISYAIYLLHAIIFITINKIGNTIAMDKYAILTLSILTTLTVSYISYHHFEKFFMKKAR